MKFNVVSFEGSHRIPYIEGLLAEKTIEFKIYKGQKTAFGWDNHKDTCMQIIKNNINKPYVIICEDDCAFTVDFELEKFKKIIKDCEADILATGVFAFVNPKKINNELVSLDGFRGTQLVVIYKSAYEKILAKASENIFFESIISKLKLNIHCTLPFLSMNGIMGSYLTKRPIDLYMKKAEEELILLKKI